MRSRKHPGPRRAPCRLRGRAVAEFALLFRSKAPRPGHQAALASAGKSTSPNQPLEKKHSRRFSVPAVPTALLSTSFAPCRVIALTGPNVVNGALPPHDLPAEISKPGLFKSATRSLIFDLDESVETFTSRRKDAGCPQ